MTDIENIASKCAAEIAGMNIIRHLLGEVDADVFHGLVQERVRVALSALAAAPVNASTGEEPVAWQWRYRDWAGSRDGTNKWSEWLDGRIPQYGRPPHEDREERALYTTPRPTSELVAALRAIAWMPSAIDDRDGLEAFNEARRIARAALTQTSGVAASLPTAGVGVKALEWDEWNEARTPFGKYHAYPGSVHFEGRSWAEDNVDNPDSKAAAQEIHDAAIRSALTEEQG